MERRRIIKCERQRKQENVCVAVSEIKKECVCTHLSQLLMGTVKQKTELHY